MAALQTNYSLDQGTPGKEWYSGNGIDADLKFTPTSTNVIDVVTDGSDEYCIRSYNPSSQTYTNIYSAYESGSTSSSCYFNEPSADAINNSSGGSPPSAVDRNTFETSVSGWSSGNVVNTVTRSSEKSRTGLFALKSVTNATWNGSSGNLGDGARKTISGVVAGGTYTVTAWVYTDDTAYPREAYWRHVQSPFLTGPSSILTPGVWNRMSFTFTAGATTAYIYLFVITPTRPATDTITVFFDDIVVKDHSLAP